MAKLTKTTRKTSGSATRKTSKPRRDSAAVVELRNALTRADLINQAAGVGLWDMSVIAGDPVNPKNEFWWSDHFRKMLGFTDERDFPNVLESWSSRLHPTDKDRVLTAFAAHLTDRTGTTPYDIEYQLALKNGQYRWFRATGATIRNKEGIPLRVAGALKDIHDEKELSLSLHSTITRADLINQAAGVGLWDMTVIAGDPVNPKNEFWWSDHFRKMLGFTDERDFPNVLESWSSRLHPTDKDRVLNAFAAHLTDRTGKTPYDIEYQLALKDGKYRWFRATGATMRDKEGIPLRVAGALKDIHDEKELSLSLHSTITRADLINQAAGVGLWDMTVIAGDPVNPKNEFWWSDHFRKMLGFTDERDFPNVLESWSSRLHPTEKDRVLNAFAAHLTDRTGTTPYDIEYQLARKDGKFRWFRATGATMRDKEGIPLRVAGALKDIHDEKELSLSLHSTITRADLINQAAGVGLWDMTVIAGDPVNPKNEFWWSDHFRKMLGFSDERDFPNVLESWSSRLHPTDKDRVLNAFAAHLTDRTGKTPYDIEYQLALKTGQYRWFRATGATMRDKEGVPLRVAGALKDIHDEKEMSLSLHNAITRADLINQASGVGLWDMSVIAGDPVNPKNEFWWSDHFRKMLGFIDERDFPNVLESWSSRLHPNDKERVLTAFAAHLTDRTGRTPYDIEYQLALKDGKYRWFRATGATIRDKEGVALRVAGALKDVHGEKETALALERLVVAAAAGDLTARISTENVEGVARTVGEKLNQLLDSIADSFRTVKVAIEQVGQASTQLRATSQMMSQTSQELNEGVERSSSEISNVADGVRANATSASMANQLVVQTSVAGKSGEERMEQMSSAMSAISSSAAQIARIIKVIDEIAFQTNLLALNAAVEAARAGRHGKGFAVVAQEVRNLAERSAAAAKETAELIEDSTAKVADGVKIADATRAALREIVANVTKVVDIAGEIAAASGEQSSALGTVAASMKQATVAAQAGSQQSTEVAAASDELSRQMRVLHGQMAKYKLASRSAARLVGLPAGATPELVAQILQSLRERAAEAKPAGAEEEAAESGPILKATGTDDPRAILPLDADERGFGEF